MPCLRDLYEEDNDTEEEESEEEDKASIDTLSELLMDRKATMRDLKKGFVFFMEQEKKDIKRFIHLEKAEK